jgi:small-conductance mechanosensitive channel
MDTIIKSLENPIVLIYFIVVILTYIIYGQIVKQRHKQKELARKQAGLPEATIIRHTIKLEEFRQEAREHALVAILSPILWAVFFVIIAKVFNLEGNTKEGLVFAFLIILVWALFSGTDVAKAVLGGLAFKVVTAFNGTIQTGDRVTIKDISGRITDIGIFYVKLQTPDDDAIAIPSASLLGEVLISANSGERASLCVLPFYFSSAINSKQLQTAEDLIWNAIQASAFYNPAQPMQIYYSQTAEHICLTAKAYVASTYNEPLFKSDVYKAVLNTVAKQSIPLATRQTNIELLKDR